MRTIHAVSTSLSKIILSKAGSLENLISTANHKLRTQSSRRHRSVNPMLASSRFYMTQKAFPSKRLRILQQILLSCNGGHCWYAYKCVVIGIYVFAKFKALAYLLATAQKLNPIKSLCIPVFLTYRLYFTAKTGILKISQRLVNRYVRILTQSPNLLKSAYL